MNSSGPRIIIRDSVQSSLLKDSERSNIANAAGAKLIPRLNLGGKEADKNNTQRLEYNTHFEQKETVDGTATSKLITSSR